LIITILVTRIKVRTKREQVQARKVAGSLARVTNARICPRRSPNYRTKLVRVISIAHHCGVLAINDLAAECRYLLIFINLFYWHATC
jgi:hypothetical protein